MTVSSHTVPATPSRRRLPASWRITHGSGSVDPASVAAARASHEAAALLATVLVCRPPPQATAADLPRQGGGSLPRPRSARSLRPDRSHARVVLSGDDAAATPEPPVPGCIVLETGDAIELPGDCVGTAPARLIAMGVPVGSTRLTPPGLSSAMSPSLSSPPACTQRSRTMLSCCLRGPPAEAVAARLAAARTGSVGSASMEEVACVCSAAFESESPDKCSAAVSIFCTALSKAALGAIRSPSSAGAVAMLVSLFRHPQEECRRAAVTCAANELDMVALLRGVLRGLGGTDPCRHWQAASNALLTLRLILGVSKSEALERLRAGGGLTLVMEVWRAGGHIPDIAQGCCAITLLLAHSHTRAAAAAGAAECALGAWHRFGHDASRAPLVQGLAETMLLCLPHLSERPPALPRLATESLRLLQGSGPAPTVSWLLRALARLAAEPKGALELAALGVSDLVLTVLGDDRWGQEVVLRRLAAEAFARPLAVLADTPVSKGGTGGNSAATAWQMPPSGPPMTLGRGGGPRPPMLPSALDALEGEACCTGPENTLTSTACAAALRRRLQAWRLRLGGGGSPAATAQEVQDAPCPLRFDADFESGSLGPVTRLGPREYEVRLLSDTAGTGAYVQWFCFRIRDMKAGEPYTFHLSNLIKPGSLFEEGCQPVIFSRRRKEATGQGWTREGADVAYYPSHDAGRRHCVSFDISFPYNEDEVFLAHAQPYTYSDLLADLARWPEVPRKSLLASCGGRDVTAVKIGDPNATYHVCIVARAHPGETTASWVMRGVLDFLLGGGAEAAGCFTGLRWVIVPMLNPDGVAMGRTRTNLDGVDLNRHHHDDSAPETKGLRVALQEELQSGQPLAFVDIHAHSRRRGVFAIGNGRDADALVACIAARTPLLDSAGTSRPEVRPQDEGVGRVAAARLGYRYSVTLEASLCARHAAAGDQHLSLEDLLAVGKAVCLGIADVAREEKSPSATPRPTMPSCNSVLRATEEAEPVDDDECG